MVDHFYELEPNVPSRLEQTRDVQKEDEIDDPKVQTHGIEIPETSASLEEATLRALEEEKKASLAEDLRLIIAGSKGSWMPWKDVVAELLYLRHGRVNHEELLDELRRLVVAREIDQMSNAAGMFVCTNRLTEEYEYPPQEFLDHIGVKAGSKSDRFAKLRPDQRREFWSRFQMGGTLDDLEEFHRMMEIMAGRPLPMTNQRVITRRQVRAYRENQPT